MTHWGSGATGGSGARGPQNDSPCAEARLDAIPGLRIVSARPLQAIAAPKEIVTNHALESREPMYRIAVVTPYYKEERSILARCRDSVLQQSYPCDLVAVADGFPSELFEGDPRTLHVKLPKANDDVGNTPRAIGGILAEAYGYDAVAYLDADNWYEPSHIERLVAAHEKTRAPLVCSKRKFYDLNGVHMNITEPAEDANRHVDTSCWLVFRPAFSLLRVWLMPKILGPAGDRIFLQKAIHDRFLITPTANWTVCFRTQYAFHYEKAGVEVPRRAKTNSEFSKIDDYLLTKTGAREVVRALGFYPTMTY